MRFEPFDKGLASLLFGRGFSDCTTRGGVTWPEMEALLQLLHFDGELWCGGEQFKQAQGENEMKFGIHEEAGSRTWRRCSRISLTSHGNVMLKTERDGETDGNSL